MTNVWEGVTGLLWVYTYIVLLASIFWAPFFVNDIFALYWKVKIRRRINEWRGNLSAQGIDAMTGVFFHDKWLTWKFGLLMISPTSDSNQALKDSGLHDMAHRGGDTTAAERELASHPVPVQGFFASRYWSVPT